MPDSPVELSPQDARRLAISSQLLAGPPPTGVMQVMQALRCLQRDPIRAVDYTQRLVLWSRLGSYDPARLDELLWDERLLFEYWAHAASLVLTEDYPIHQTYMRHLAGGGRRADGRAWMEKNAALRAHVLQRLAEEGPLQAGAIEDHSLQAWESSGWTNGRTVNMMLDMLWSEGAVMVAGRRRRTRLWDLSTRCLPEWTPREELNARQATRLAAQHALRALGVASARQINVHFTRNRYDDLSEALADLQEAGLIVPAKIAPTPGDDAGANQSESWYVHVDSLPLLERIQAGDWQPRTTLLSPFDNLICDRQRTELLFGFHYRIEIYVPKAKRQYGYYVLPILHGDRLIGRVDSKMDRKKKCWHIHNLYVEPGNEPAASAAAVVDAIRSLASFLDAHDIVAPEAGHAPEPWRVLLAT